MEPPSLSDPDAPLQSDEAPAASRPAPALSRPAAWALALTATLTMSVSYIDRQTLAAIAPATPWSASTGPASSA